MFKKWFKKRNKVFISYSHNDEQWLKRLQVHLAPLESKGLVDIWDDTELEAGDDWGMKIQESMDSSRVAVLLITADFLASEFIMQEEVPQLVVDARRGYLTIISVIISHSSFAEHKKLRKYQTINSPEAPVDARTPSNQEAVFAKLEKRIEDILSNQISWKEKLSLATRRYRWSLLFLFIVGTGIFAYSVVRPWFLEKQMDHASQALKENNRALALQHFKYAHWLDWNNWNYPFELALISEDRSDEAQAMKYYKVADSTCEKNRDACPVVVNNLARLLIRDGKHEDALTRLMQVSNRFPGMDLETRFTVLKNIGWAYSRMPGRDSDAQLKLEESLDLINQHIADLEVSGNDEDTIESQNSKKFAASCLLTWLYKRSGTSIEKFRDIEKDCKYFSDINALKEELTWYGNATEK